MHRVCESIVCVISTLKAHCPYLLNDPFDYCVLGTQLKMKDNNFQKGYILELKAYCPSCVSESESERKR